MLLSFDNPFYVSENASRQSSCDITHTSAFRDSRERSWYVDENWAKHNIWNLDFDNCQGVRVVIGDIVNAEVKT